MYRFGVIFIFSPLRSNRCGILSGRTNTQGGSEDQPGTESRGKLT
jgi:hypothetical protein